MPDVSKQYITEKRKVITVVVLLVFFLCAGFSSYIFIHGRAAINRQIDIQVKDIQVLARIIEKSSTEKYRKRIKSFLNTKAAPGREKVIQSFAQKNRKELLRLSIPYLNLLEKEDKYFFTFVWFLPDNHVFLRIPKPKMFGDDVSYVRPDVAKANRDLVSVSGYLTAYSGMDYRIVEPVIYKGQHLGTIQFGLKDTFLIDAIENELQVSVAQVMPSERFKVVTFSKIPHINSGSYTIQARNIKFIESIAPKINWNLSRQQVSGNDRTYIVNKVKTLNNYRGAPEGWIFSFLDITTEQAAMHSNVLRVALTSIILIMIISLLITRSYDRLILRAEELNQKLNNTNQLLEDKVLERTTALRNEQEKLYVTLRSIGEGVITTDIDGNIVLINKVSEQLTGWSQQEAIGQPLQKVFNIIHEDTGVPRISPVENVLLSGCIIGPESQAALISKDGTIRSIEDSIAPIFDKDSNCIGTVLVFRDVTEKQKTAKELLKIEKLESIGLLAGGIAHDFNNILTAIIGNIELAGMCVAPDSEAYPLLQEATKASVRAKKLTQQLLTFSKGGDPIKKTSSIAETLTSSAEFVLRGSHVSCHFTIPEDLFLVDIDAGQISQVIQNLVINAKHAMVDGGQISIECSNVVDISQERVIELEHKAHIKITVTDTGGGISDDYLKKIFDPYFTTKEEGSGLGLAISHSIIKKHHGHLSVQSVKNKGTTFTIYLPAAEKQNVPLDVPERDEPKYGDATIIIMDDDSFIQEIAEQMLIRLGHTVLLADNGHQAIEIYQQRHHEGKAVDVIIMDLTIPGGMGGKEALAEILKIDGEAKAIVSSGYSNDPIMANCKKYGFKAAISKPFLLADLQKVINTVLG